MLVCLLLGCTHAEVRAQPAPVASTLRLEELLRDIGDRFGIAITSEMPLEEEVVIDDLDSSAETALRRVLGKYSYLLVYSGPWTGPLAASPNRLHVFASESGGSVRLLNATGDQARRPMSDDGLVDAMARVDDIVAVARRDGATLASALATELATAAQVAVREEAV